MEIRNTTTNKIEEIEIVDLFSGADWTRDAIGDCDDINYNDDTDEYEMDQDCISWWTEYASKCDKANRLWDTLDDDKKKEVKQSYTDSYTKFNEAPGLLINIIER